MRPPTPESQQNAVDAWNAQVGVGDRVLVTQDDGSELDTVTRSEAWVLGGHTAVVLVEGISGGYLLSRVRAVEKAAL